MGREGSGEYCIRSRHVTYCDMDILLETMDVR